MVALARCCPSSSARSDSNNTLGSTLLALNLLAGFASELALGLAWKWPGDRPIDRPAGRSQTFAPDASHSDSALGCCLCCSSARRSVARSVWRVCLRVCCSLRSLCSLWPVGCSICSRLLLLLFGRSHNVRAAPLLTPSRLLPSRLPLSLVLLLLFSLLLLLSRCPTRNTRCTRF
jgi:hypothetical protein